MLVRELPLSTFFLQAGVLVSAPTLEAGSSKEGITVKISCQVRMCPALSFGMVVKVSCQVHAHPALLFGMVVKVNLQVHLHLALPHGLGWEGAASTACTPPHTCSLLFHMAWDGSGLPSSMRLLSAYASIWNLHVHMI